MNFILVENNLLWKRNVPMFNRISNSLKSHHLTWNSIKLKQQHICTKFNNLSLQQQTTTTTNNKNTINSHKYSNNNKKKHFIFIYSPCSQINTLYKLNTLQISTTNILSFLFTFYVVIRFYPTPHQKIKEISFRHCHKIPLYTAPKVKTSFRHSKT